eukprot:m.175998 g.175998  ORF g.175998 m.175998 type:complete len:1316 (-) comp21374_c0_seq1:121-4068(-)
MMSTAELEDIDRTDSYRAAVASPVSSRHGAGSSQRTPSTAALLPSGRSFDDSAEAADVDANFEAWKHPHVHPLQRSLLNPYHFFMYLTFSWVNPLLAVGNKRQLSRNDLVDVPTDSIADVLVTRLEKTLQEVRHLPHALLRAWLHAFWRRALEVTLWFFFEILLIVASAVLLGQVVSVLQNNKSDAEGCLYAALLTLASFGVVTTHHVGYLKAWRIGMDLRTSAVGLVYRKALKVNKQSMAGFTTGMIVNIVSNDVERFILAALFVPYVVIVPIQLGLVIYLIWRLVGYSAFIGVGVYILLSPIQILLSRLFTKMRGKTAAQTDERVKLMSEVISGIKIIKMYAWEKPFGRLIAAVRARELGYIRNTAYLKAFNLAFFYVSGPLIVFLVVLSYDQLSNELTAEKVFTTMALLNTLRLPVTIYFPGAVQTLSELRVVFRRIDSFLQTEDSALRPRALGGDADAEDSARASLSLTNVSCAWTERTVLHDLTLLVEGSKLVAVVGPVGAGKSTLLMAILAELQPHQGTVEVHGRLSYTPQEAWILSGTVRDNIVFGEKFDQAWYEQVVDACQLRTDLIAMPDGDMTEIGERGVTLSGGQKARVSLARAVYANADIVLMDDPLSAVDTKVGRAIMDDCICSLLRNKLRVLVTHQLQYVSQADVILVLDGEGHITGQGTYDELIATGHKLDFEFMTVDDAHDELQQQEGEPADKSSTSVVRSRRPSRLVQEEARAAGAVSKQSYTRYALSSGPLWSVIVLVVVGIAAQANNIGVDYWLSYWVGLDPSDRDENINVTIYAILVSTFIVFGFLRTFLFMAAAVRASRSLHDRCFQGLLGTHMRFFDTNPIGRILNRFSMDMGLMDELLPLTFLDFLQLFLIITGVLLLTGILNPWLFILTLPLVLLFWRVRRHYISCGREIKRIEATERSPLYSTLSSSLAGLAVIRGHAAQPRFRQEFNKHQDNYSKAFFMFVMLSRWLGFRLDMLATVFIGAVVFGAIAARQSVDAGEAGLSLAYAIQITSIFQWCVRQSTEVETQMTSVERIVDFGALRSEETHPVSNAKEEQEIESKFKNWPSSGKVEFSELSLRYAEDLDWTLKGFNATVRPTEKVGIVGRTGAGKSSIISAFFRLSPTNGQLLIDGIDTGTVPLHILRSRISVIPQDPVLFSGTVRYNLDPFSTHTDTELWSALEDVQLKQAVSSLSGGLDALMTESGANFSVGQRQLVCLARAILRTSKILILDEATANVDTATDELIQTTIRTKFRHCTVFTVAHRLNTIMDSDRVMVLESGRLMEFDTPANLRQKENGLFAALVNKMSNAPLL